MAVNYIFEYDLKPIEDGLKDINKFASATFSGSYTTDEPLTIQFPTALSVPNLKGVKKNVRATSILRYKRTEDPAP